MMNKFTTLKKVVVSEMPSDAGFQRWRVLCERVVNFTRAARTDRRFVTGLSGC
jgi:hypothetical protein